MKKEWKTETIEYNHHPYYANEILENFVDYLNRNRNLGISRPEKRRYTCQKEVYIAQREGIIIRTTQNDRHDNHLIMSVSSKTCPGLAKRITEDGLIKAFPNFDFRR